MHDGERQNNVPVARLLCKLVLLSAVTGPLFATTQAPSGQSVSHPTAGVTSVRISRTVSVQMTVFSAKKELLIPYCAEGEGGTEILCNLSIHIETRAEWRPMKPRHREVVLGGIPPDKWKFRLIPAEQRRDFLFAFNKDDFAVHRGQRLRVVV